jgi:hypothetical protein
LLESSRVGWCGAGETTEPKATANTHDPTIDPLGLLQGNKDADNVGFVMP